MYAFVVVVVVVVVVVIIVEVYGTYTTSHCQSADTTNLLCFLLLLFHLDS